MNNYKLAPDELTRAGTPDSKSGVRTRQDFTPRMFNEGKAHMYENPVEREMMFLQAALEKQAMLEAKLNAIRGAVSQTVKKAA